MKIAYKSDILQLVESKRDKVSILGQALGLMQQYGGRSKVDCIALAMGYEIGWDYEKDCTKYIKGE